MNTTGGSPLSFPVSPFLPCSSAALAGILNQTPNAMSIIDEELAKAFLDDPDVDLSEATKITDAAAESLSKYQGKIDNQDPKEWVASLCLGEE